MCSRHVKVAACVMLALVFACAAPAQEPQLELPPIEELSQEELLAEFVSTWESLGKLITTDPETAISALERAIALEAGLVNWPFEMVPRDQIRGTLQNKLGDMYAHRLVGDRADNLDAAIAAYQGALQVIRPEAFPLAWAAIQYNLGTAYLLRIRGERADNLEAAIAAYKAALEVNPRAADPVRWAQTQDGLGIAYTERIRGERADNLEAAIAAFEAALEVNTRAADPVRWARTQH